MINLEEHKQRLLKAYQPKHGSGEFGVKNQGRCGYCVNWSSMYLTEVSKYESVLDVGCGNGAFCKQCAENTHIKKVYGLDAASVTNGHTIPHDKITYFDAWSHDIPMPDKSVDVIVTCEVLEHIAEEHVGKTLQEFKRVTRYKVFGQVAMHDSCESYHDGMNAHICVKDKGWWIQRFNEAGFSVDKEGTPSNYGQGLKFTLSHPPIDKLPQAPSE
jgi:ubiquinone/menaquinone biosynthesis C-methylase UbiE